MSLDRTALRLATVMALSNGFVAPFPTMAGPRVYDSRIDSVQVTEEDEVLALITVCTDDDSGETLSQNNGGPPFRRTVTLSIDLHLGIPSKPSGDEAGDILHLGTESDLERRLDLFEFQVERILSEGFGGTWGTYLADMPKRFNDWSSIRYVERDGNIRLAARQIQLNVTLLFPPPDFVVMNDPPPGPAPVPAPLGPLLDAIIDSGSPFAPDAQAIQDEILASGAGAYTALPPLKRIRIVEDERDLLDRRTNPRSQPPEPGVAHAEPEQT